MADVAAKKRFLRESFNIERDLVHYMNAASVFDQLTAAVKRQATHFVASSPTVFSFAVELRLPCILDKYMNLAKSLLTKPLRVEDSCNKIVRLVLHQLIGRALDPTLVQARIKLIEMPPFCAKIGLKKNHLKVFPAALTNLSPLLKRAQLTVWHCSIDQTERLLSSAPPSKPLCRICLTPMDEALKLRETYDCYDLVLMPSRAFEAPTPTLRALKARIWAADAPDLVLGAQYFICLVNNPPVGYRVMYMEACTAPIRPVQDTITDDGIGSGWSTSFSLAALTSGLLYPMYCFMPLKLGLLLSLVSARDDKGCRPIPILAVGRETLFAEKLMGKCAQLAARHVRWSHSALLAGKMDANGYLEAGLLSMAHGGVALMGHWDKFSTDKSGAALRSALDCGKITLGNELGQNASIPLNAAIWTYWDIPKKAKEIKQMQTIINLFGLPFLIDDDSLLDALCYDLAKQSRLKVALEKEEKHQNQCHWNALRQRILRARQQPSVPLSPQAEAMLKAYFVTSRRLRPEGGSLPLKQLDYLAALAESHARLVALSSRVVRVEDALVAIWLCEVSQNGVYGATLLGYDQPPKLDFRDLKKIDESMASFAAWLYDFIGPTLKGLVELEKSVQIPNIYLSSRWLPGCCSCLIREN